MAGTSLTEAMCHKSTRGGVYLSDERKSMGLKGWRVIEPDDLLLERLGQGDEAAFETLFLRHYAPVYRAVYRLAGSREATEDLVQETFLALLHRPPRPAASGPLVAWLCRVALNRGYNVLRGEQRERGRLERWATPPQPDDPHAVAVQREDRAHVRAALARLPERQGRLLLLLAGLYVVHSLAVMLAIFASVDTISGEIASHTIQALVTKPVRRWQVLLGKWLGYAAMLVVYLLLLGGGIILATSLLVRYVPPNPLQGLLLLILEALVLLSLSLLGGTRLSTLTNGVALFMLYGVAFMAPGSRISGRSSSRRPPCASASSPVCSCPSRRSGGARPT